MAIQPIRFIQPIRSEIVEAGDKFFGVINRNNISHVKGIEKEDALNLMQV